MPGQVQRGGRGIIPTHLHLSARRRCMVSTTLATLPWEVHNTHWTGSWAGLGTSLDGTKNLMPTGTWSPDCPAIMLCQSPWLLHTNP